MRYILKNRNHEEDIKDLVKYMMKGQKGKQPAKLTLNLDTMERGYIAASLYDKEDHYITNCAI